MKAGPTADPRGLHRAHTVGITVDPRGGLGGQRHREVGRGGVKPGSGTACFSKLGTLRELV